MRRSRGRPRKSDAPVADQGADKQRALLLAGLEAFARAGYHGVGLREIAAVVGVDPTLITHHFGSKLGLWQAAVDEIAGRIETGIQVASLERARGDNGLADIMVGLIDVVCDTPQFAAFVLREIAQQDERFGYMYTRLVKPVHDLLMPHVVRARDLGELRNVDPDFFFLSITGAIVITVASRPFLARMTDGAQENERFRSELKRVVEAQMFPFGGENRS